MSSAREKILEVAGGLFFQYGYRAIGIDMIIAESQIAKATLYRHFKSKDELIVAYLEEMNRQFWAWFDGATAPHDDPKDQLIAVFDALQKLVSTPTCYGCPFLIAASEFPDPTHPSHEVARQNKELVRARLSALCHAMGAKNPDALASQLYLMMDGAFMAVRMYGVDNPANRVGEFARQMVAGAM
ncbi:MAG: TetR/AcrR family transcriptional regulator [Anaerolineae bacterium]|nr:TetR/AcrR family transcriptional regulator [Anaerolineae bacterium]